MDDLPNGYAVFAAMAGVETSVLCPVALTEFPPLLDEVRRLPGQLNKTNVWEQAIVSLIFRNKMV